jgi:hypothetical protein
MPGLCLTALQAARLFGVDRDICEPLLAACVDAGFLRLIAGGYVRA